MTTGPNTSTPRNLVTPLLITALFLLIRLVYLYAREPFFDELYTLWMARQPLSSIVPHLLHDSGPPLYYFLARLSSVTALRWVSLLFATVPLVLILTKRSLGNARFVAAALLAVYPPAAFYATEARAYALCAMLVTMGVLLLDDDRPFAAAIELVLAAYSHYYGVLFFPLLLMKGRRGILAFVLACVLFIPGFVLAFHQPAEAMAWNVFQPRWAPLDAVALVVLVIAVARSWRFAPAVLIPIGLVIAFSLAGRHIYFPMRFESVIAVPLVLWAAVSLERWRPAVRYALVTVLMIIGSFVIVPGIAEELRRPTHSCVRAAMFVARSGANDVVAGDYCYLFAATQLGTCTAERQSGDQRAVALGKSRRRPCRLGPRVAAFPPQQAEHPGWYRPLSLEAARSAARSLPANGFVFIGNALTPETAAIKEVRRVQVLFGDGTTVVLRVEPAGLTTTVH